jgi:hypothetical protein
MTISNSDFASAAEGNLRDLRDRLRKMKVTDIDALKVEEEIRSQLDALGRELMTEVFARADIDDQEVLINGLLHGRVDRHRAKIHTSFGVCEVWRTMYRRDRKSAPVSPLDKRLGIVESFYTPKCAKIVCLLPALLVREDMEAVLREVSGITVGAATMHRLPQTVMARYERSRETIERTVRERDEVPANAVFIQGGLDGVMVPQEGQHCRPRGRNSSDEPEPARWESKYPGATPPGPAARDAHTDRAWHEASVATLAYFDIEGRHLHTVYVGRMPEEHKATLGEMLNAEMQLALEKRPDLTPILASDGAPGQWNILADIRAQMPDGPRERATELIDFFHVAEHLQDAADAIDGKGTAESKVRRAGWCELLKGYDDGAERVLQALRHQRRIATKESTREEVDAVLGYIANNQHRMAFHTAIQRKMPIATGPTEAAAKSLVGVRMKRSGARFSQHGGQTILTLLASHKSCRFDNLFDVVAQTYTAPVSRAA